MNANDVSTTMKLIAELWPRAGWPPSMQHDFATHIGTLKLTAAEAAEVLHSVRRNSNWEKVKPGELVKPLEAAALTLTVRSSESSEIRVARRDCRMPHGSLADLTTAYLLHLTGTRREPWHTAKAIVWRMLESAVPRERRAEKVLQERIATRIEQAVLSSPELQAIATKQVSVLSPVWEQFRRKVTA